ncbi:MAG: glutamate--tRNA ligase [Anaerolineae bacterium]
MAHDSQPDTVRVRFPPSPTGLLHVGGLRSALFNWLFARHHGGVFILRIEDTDRKRYEPEALSDILDSLRWLGLDWDEGPEVGGDYGPYFQSERLDIYRQFARQLIENGHAYYCFCTPERLARLRQEQTQRKDEFVGYDRHCRSLDPGQAAERVAAGERAVVRLKMPLEGQTTFHDLIRGEITVDNSTQDDLVLLKSDGYPTYHLANVVDDHLMRITHIMRAEEWISTAPRHVQLYRAFGWQMPAIAHLPVVLDPSGKGKMSKRRKAGPGGQDLPVLVRDFRAAGYLPEAMFNFLALVGWSYDGHTELMTREEIIQRFSIRHINPAPAAFNYDKLDYMNGVYIRALAADDLADRMLPFLTKAGLAADREVVVRLVPLVQERMKRLDEAPGVVDFFFMEELPDYEPGLLIPKKMDAASTHNLLSQARAVLEGANPFSQDVLERALRDLAERLDVKAGQLFSPIRVAVCGRPVAPPLFGTLEVLGRERVLARIDAALAKLKTLGLE